MSKLQELAKLTCASCAEINPLRYFEPVIIGEGSRGRYGLCVCFDCAKQNNWTNQNENLTDVAKREVGIHLALAMLDNAALGRHLDDHGNRDEGGLNHNPHIAKITADLALAEGILLRAIGIDLKDKFKSLV